MLSVPFETLKLGLEKERLRGKGESQVERQKPKGNTKSTRPNGQAVKRDLSSRGLYRVFPSIPDSTMRFQVPSLNDPDVTDSEACYCTVV